MTITIRPFNRDDYDAWYPLWQGYLTFYKSSVEDSVTRNTFSRVIDPDGDIHAFAAIDENGEMVGFTTYLFHAFTWSDAPRCYLNDLFTKSDLRGKGTGRQLIDAVCKAAKEEGAAQVYWLTQEFNYPGRTLYDKVAEKTDFIKYSKNV